MYVIVVLRVGGHVGVICMFMCVMCWLSLIETSPSGVMYSD